MDQSYFELIEILVIAGLAAAFILLLVLDIRGRRRKSPSTARVILLDLDTILLACAVAFAVSHPTSYRFNDRAVLGSQISEIIGRYGGFDQGELHEGSSGRIGYYIYTDNGPVMPDHLRYYYWIYYDESGTVYKVEAAPQPGG
ncbi:MAG: hypothetical protein IJ071_07430 [Ruminococcus sp.]|nr:hypothetical protein [Ruminococcus sp.]